MQRRPRETAAENQDRGYEHGERQRHPADQRRGLAPSRAFGQRGEAAQRIAARVAGQNVEQPGSRRIRQHRDDLRAEYGRSAHQGRADLGDRARPPRADGEKQREREHQPQPRAEQAAREQGGIEREPVRAALQRAGVGERQ